jgi:FtsZ-binding cell division protein ZapB
MPPTKSETKVPVKSILQLRAENALKLKEWKEKLAQESVEAVRSREKLEERVKKLEEEDARQTERMDDVEEKIAKLERKA